MYQYGILNILNTPVAKHFFLDVQGFVFVIFVTALVKELFKKTVR